MESVFNVVEICMFLFIAVVILAPLVIGGIMAAFCYSYEFFKRKGK